MEGRREDSSINAIYRERLLSRRTTVAHGDALHERISWARLALLLLAIGIVVALRYASPPWLVIPLLIFVPLAFYHGRVLNARDRAARAVTFYERGLARLEGRWQGGGITGERFRDPAHLYADDLDLFGQGSLFELIATTRTTGGERVLADWLLRPAAISTILDRQHALQELEPRLDLREDLAVLGPDLQAGVRTEDLEAWATAPPQLTQTWPRIVAPLVAAAATSGIGLWIWSGTPPPWLGLAILVEIAFALFFWKRVHHVAHGVEKREQELAVLAALMARIERDPVSTPLLTRLRDELHATGRSPAVEIRLLARIVDVLSSGHNQIFGPIAALLLLQTQLAFAVERWRARC